MIWSLDICGFRLLNGLAGRSAVVDWLARFLVNDYVVPSTLAIMLVWLWFRGTGAQGKRNREAVLNAVAAQFVANMILKAINLVYFRPRPFDRLGDVNLLFYRPWDSSFPSNPATFASALSVAIYARDRRLGCLSAVLSALWGLARVFCGVHYPTDVLVGMALGGGVGWWLSCRSNAMAALRRWLLGVLEGVLVA